MGNGGSIDCPRTSAYINNTLKPEQTNLTNTINNLNISIKNIDADINKYTKSNQDLQTQISKMFTKAQLDTAVANAIKPLQDQIETNNNTIAALTAEKKRLIGTRDDLLKQLGKERQILDQSVTMANNGIRNSAYGSANIVYDSNQKTYDYYNAIRQQNQKLLDKSSDSKSDNLKYDQRAFYQIERYDFTVKINFILYIIYYIFLIILIGIFVFVQKNMSIFVRIVMIVLLIIYPFVIFFAEKLLYDAGSYTYSTINRNVYFNDY
jgi:hypothetical protein